MNKNLNDNQLSQKVVSTLFISSMIVLGIKLPQVNGQDKIFDVSESKYELSEVNLYENGTGKNVSVGKKINSDVEVIKIKDEENRVDIVDDVEEIKKDEEIQQIEEDETKYLEDEIQQRQEEEERIRFEQEMQKIYDEENRRIEEENRKILVAREESKRQKEESKRQKEERLNILESGYHSDIKFNIDCVGEPLYKDYLYYILYILPEGLKEFYYVNNLNLILLDNENGAENTYINLEGSNNYGIMSGFNIGYYVNNEIVLYVYVEACNHDYFYDEQLDFHDVYTREEFNRMITRYYLIHELGHFIDWKFNFKFSNSIDFNDIYYSELNNYLNSNFYKEENLSVFTNVSSSIEYFATVFANYIINPDDLRNYCPRTYDYINTLVENINYEYYTDGSDNNNSYILTK